MGAIQSSNNFKVRYGKDFPRPWKVFASIADKWSMAASTPGRYPTSAAPILIRRSKTDRRHPCKGGVTQGPWPQHRVFSPTGCHALQHVITEINVPYCIGLPGCNIIETLAQKPQTSIAGNSQIFTGKSGVAGRTPAGCAWRATGGKHAAVRTSVRWRVRVHSACFYLTHNRLSKRIMASASKASYSFQSMAGNAPRSSRAHFPPRDRKPAGP